MATVLRVSHDQGCAAFAAALEAFVAAAEGLDDHDLLAASHCWGWAVVDVVVHVRAGLDEVAAALLGVEDSGEPTCDAASYWLSMPPSIGSDDEATRILATRRVGSATARPTSAVAQLRAVASALRSAVERLGDGRMGFQGHVMTVGDFLTTWAVELVVHQLDLGRDLDVRPPSGLPLTLTRRTLETLLEAPLPVANDVDAVLLGTGRRPPTDAERSAIGSSAGRLPLL